MSDSLFNISALTENELGHVEYVLTSPSYARVFRVFLMSIHDSCIKMILDNSEERRNRLSDECLIERAKAVSALVTFFDKIVEEAQFDRIQRARSDDPDDKYVQLLASGRIGPAGIKDYGELPVEEQY